MKIISGSFPFPCTSVACRRARCWIVSRPRGPFAEVSCTGGSGLYHHRCSGGVCLQADDGGSRVPCGRSCPGVLIGA